MLKIFSILDTLLPRSAPAHQDTDAAWVSDPLRHPDIARMDARELGDLPFPGRCRPHDAPPPWRDLRRLRLALRVVSFEALAISRAGP